MDIQHDGKKHPYVEVPINGGFIRMTYIAEGWDDSPAVRIQIKDNSTGRLRQGPEVPVAELGKMYSATLDLLVAKHQTER